MLVFLDDHAVKTVAGVQQGQSRVVGWAGHVRQCAPDQLHERNAVVFKFLGDLPFVYNKNAQADVPTNCPDRFQFAPAAESGGCVAGFKGTCRKGKHRGRLECGGL